MSKAHKDLQREFQKLWISGCLGAFFFALLRTAVSGIPELSISNMDTDYTWDMTVRYAYIVWFVLYFFMSSLVHLWSKTQSGRDIVFDVAQSLLSFLGAVFLGFIVPIKDFLWAENFRLSIGAANAALLIIGGLSFALLRKHPDGRGGRTGGYTIVDGLRGLAALLSAIVIGVVLCSTNKSVVRQTAFYCIVAMYIILVAYGIIRIGEARIAEDKEPPLTEQQVAFVKSIIATSPPGPGLTGPGT